MERQSIYKGDTILKTIDDMSFLNLQNATFIDSLYEQYKKDPGNIENSWQFFFQGYDFAAKSPLKEEIDGTKNLPAKIEHYISLIRKTGHYSANLNPLAQDPPSLEHFEPARFGLDKIDPKRKFKPNDLPVPTPLSFNEISKYLKQTYCGSIGVDFRDIHSFEAIVWLQERMERCKNTPTFSRDLKIRLFKKLAQAQGLENFLQTRFLGHKRFSLEGLEALIPLLDILCDEVQKGGGKEIILGMAHRGRLNVLINILGKPIAKLFQEFEDSEYRFYDIDGDVKYHLGYANRLKTFSKGEIDLYLAPNPSHLEAVNPVVEGVCRSRQESLNDVSREKVIPILIHGDASFAGQGSIAECLNLSLLKNYETGGTIHVITNNQIGFTTDPSESRSTTYCSDIAKMIRSPIFHVNADDVEAVIWCATLASGYRQKFKRDVIINLMGYRRYGHNETDDPSMCHPLMYQHIKNHPPILALYKKKIEEEKILTPQQLNEEVNKLDKEWEETLKEVREKTYKTKPCAIPAQYMHMLKTVKTDLSMIFTSTQTAVNRERLKNYGSQILTFPDSFTPHPKVKKLFEKRRSMIEGELSVDWGMGELLAYATLLKDGITVRLSGQDSQRGTFSHRHAVLRDYKTGSPFHILKQDNTEATGEIVNSPLSEFAILGYEFGYSVADKNSLIIWEAQFGDFSNGGQIIIDQFIAASEAKWNQTSNLVLYLPHGYEGMGPEHSNARPERFLQLCGNLNFQIVNLTTPAQLFHALRRQVYRTFKKPLIIFTPKSLLRHPKAVSALEEFSDGHFHEVIDSNESELVESLKINRVIFCTGKIYYDLIDARESMDDHSHIAIIRIEQLYPFPKEKIESIIESYPNAIEVLWVQEEPQNMGAWSYLRHQLSRNLSKCQMFRYGGRPPAGTTAEGSTKSHIHEQKRIVQDALGLVCPLHPEQEQGLHKCKNCKDLDDCWEKNSYSWSLEEDKKKRTVNHSMG